MGSGGGILELLGVPIARLSTASTVSRVYGV